MHTVKKAGGLAFPWPFKVPGHSPMEPGLSLRDFFAATALQGILSNPTMGLPIFKDDPSLAQAAYEYADAMLRARGK